MNRILLKPRSGAACWCFYLPMVLLVAGLLGCAKGGYTTAGVKGKVTYQGQPVTAGSLTFSPTASDTKSTKLGKPASGQIGADGSYTLSTYAQGDGAVVGQHRVTYAPPSPESPTDAPTPDAKPKTAQYLGLVPKEQQVEVKAGSNEINIELVPSAPAPK